MNKEVSEYQNNVNFVLDKNNSNFIKCESLELNKRIYKHFGVCETLARRINSSCLFLNSKISNTLLELHPESTS